MDLLEHIRAYFKRQEQEKRLRDENAARYADLRRCADLRCLWVDAVKAAAVVIGKCHEKNNGNMCHNYLALPPDYEQRLRRGIAPTPADAEQRLAFACRYARASSAERSRMRAEYDRAKVFYGV